MRFVHSVYRSRYGFVALLSLGVAAASCVNSGTSQDELVGVAKQAETAVDVCSRVLGFDGNLSGSSADWKTSAGSISSSSVYSQGSKSIAISGTNHAEITSIPLSALPGTAESTVKLDVRLPASSAGQAWKGQVAVVLNSPSLGINSRNLGYFQYTSDFVAGTFKTVSIAIPADIITLLNGRSFTDLTVTLAFDLPDQTQTTYVDNIRFSSAPSVSGGVGGATSTGGSSGLGGSTTGTVVPMSVQLPFGSDLFGVALGATNTLVVNDGVVVQSQPPGSNADIVSLGADETNIGSTANIVGDVWSVGSVKVRSNGIVTKDVHTQGTATCADTCDMRGTEFEHSTLTPSRTYSWSVTFPAATEAVFVDHTVRTVPPGSYSTFTIQPNSTVRLSSGTYYIERFVAESNSILSIDASSGPVIIYVRDSFTYRGAVTGASAAEVFIGYSGTELANIDAPIKATVVAPNAKLRLGPVDGSGQEGSFFGQSILADARNPIRFVPFKYWDWILPPKLTVECVTRSGASYGAGVFSYENVLDIPITIREGVRNNISTSTRREQGPLEVFLPGTHKNVFWLPFYGPSIEWNLAGTKFVVDDSTPRCTLENYRLEKPKLETWDELTPLPDVVSSKLVPQIGTVPLVIPTSAVQIPYEATTSTGTADGAPSGTIRQLSLYFYDMDPGDSCIFGKYNVDADVKVNGEFKRTKLWKGAWTLMAQGVPLGEVMTFDVAASVSSMPIEIDIWDRHDWPCSDYHLFKYDFTYDVNTTVPVKWGPNDGWSLKAKISSVFTRPKICAEWPAQYLDSGYGEDKLNNLVVNQVPASFARVRLDITGGKAPFTPWPSGTYVTLDKDGCLPEKFAPTEEQLTPANSTFAVSLQWQGQVSAPVDEAGNELVFQIERTRDGDPWEVCKCTGSRFFKSYGVLPCTTRNAAGDTISANKCSFGLKGTTPMVPVVSNGVLDSANPVDSQGRMMFAFGTGPAGRDVPTEYSSTGGVVSQLLRQHAINEFEMGLAPGKIHIWPESPSAFQANSPFHSSAGSASERYLEARPVWREQLDNGSIVTREADSNRKFTMGHEIGHAIQAMGSGSTGNGRYVLKLVDPRTGTDKESSDPPSLAPECRCNHVGTLFSPAHCMNSLEVVGTAAGEGFGHFYAARLWNNPADTRSDCWIPYAKWALLPECPTLPSGEKVDCLRVGDPDNSLADPEKNAYKLIEKLYSDPVDRNYLRTTLADWYFVKGPSLISCADASRWRNKHCAEDTTGKVVTPATTEAALNELGNEMDWMQFFWSMTSSTDAWKMQQFFTLQKAACSSTLCNDEEVISMHAWKKYEELSLNPTPELLPSAPNGVSGTQWLHFVNEGFLHGVSLDLTNK